MFENTTIISIFNNDLKMNLTLRSPKRNFNNCKLHYHLISSQMSESKNIQIIPNIMSKLVANMNKIKDCNNSVMYGTC